MVHLNTPGHGSRIGSPKLGSLREAPSGARTLCLTSIRSEDRLGDVIATDPWLEDAVAPLVARFAALVFTEQSALIEPLLQQLRWLGIEHGIDHVILPLWPESKLAQEIEMMATVMGLPHDFVLTQDEDEWPHHSAVYQLPQQLVSA